MNPSTDTWIVAYFSILILLITFILGYPALVFNLTIPPELRKVVNCRIKKKINLVRLAALSLLVFSLGIIWGVRSVSTISFVNFRTMLLFADVVMTTTLVSLVVFWFWFFHNSDLEYAVRNLKKLITGIVSKNEWSRNAVQKKNYLDCLQDLKCIGEKSRSGDDKNQVLETFRIIAAQIQSKANYDGDQLGEIIQYAHDVISDRDHPGSESNYLSCLELFSMIINQIKLFKSRPDRSILENDEVMIDKIICLTGIQAVKRGYDRVVSQIVEETYSGPETVFRMGLSALSEKDYFQAEVCLNKLFADAWKKGFADAMTNAFLFGVMIDFFNIGETYRDKICDLLETISHSNVSMDATIRESITKHQSLLNIDTADALKNWRDL
jgi:hypothetical protein